MPKTLPNNKRHTRREIKQKLVEYKNGKCEVCGYDRCIGALTFHHIDPSKKRFGISESAHKYPFEEVIAEISTCVLLCSNCHIEFHEGLLDLSKILSEN